MICEPELWEMCYVWVAWKAAVSSPRPEDNLLPRGLLMPNRVCGSQTGSRGSQALPAHPLASTAPVWWWRLGFLLQHINSVMLALKNPGGCSMRSPVDFNWILELKIREIDSLHLFTKQGIFFSFPVINFLKCKVTSLKWKQFIACQEQSLPNLRNPELKLLKHISECLYNNYLCKR